MKRFLIIILALAFILLLGACSKKAAKVEPVQGPAVETVDEPVAQVEKPVLSEEELFQQKSLEELNKDQVLKMIHFDFDMYSIREDMKPVMQANANWLLKFPSVEVLVEGHCDERGHHRVQHRPGREARRGRQELPGFAGSERRQGQDHFLRQEQAAGHGRR